jgi:uncharacterized protein (TIGR00661 family)
MAKIFYGVCGEGRGHSTRVQTIVEDLRGYNDIVIYTPGHAYDFLAPVYQNTNVAVRRIPGLSFHYDASRSRVDYCKTSWRTFRNLFDFPGAISQVQQDIEVDQPDLVITDFEPIVPRAARRAGVPFISLNHQHFLLTYDLRSLPPYLRWHASLMAQVVRTYYSGQAQTIVSSFYFPPLKPGCQNVTQIGVLLRREILYTQPEEGKHVVAYFRRFTSKTVLEALGQCGCEVRLYGLGAHPPRGQLRFLKVDAYRFMEDLATSRALISTAGNQLVGEALFLKKPVLAIPEQGNYEQHINGHFLQGSGAGIVVDMEAITPAHIRRFLDSLENLRSCIDRPSLLGNPVALEIINRYLGNYASPRAVATMAPQEAMA